MGSDRYSIGWFMPTGRASRRRDEFQSPLDAIQPIVDPVQEHADLGAKFRVVAFHMRHDTLDCAQPCPLFALLRANLLQVGANGAPRCSRTRVSLIDQLSNDAKLASVRPCDEEIVSGYKPPHRFLPVLAGPWPSDPSRRSAATEARDKPWHEDEITAEPPATAPLAAWPEPSPRPSFHAPCHSTNFRTMSSACVREIPAPVRRNKALISSWSSGTAKMGRPAAR